MVARPPPFLGVPLASRLTPLAGVCSPPYRPLGPCLISPSRAGPLRARFALQSGRGPKLRRPVAARRLDARPLVFSLSVRPTTSGLAVVAEVAAVRPCAIGGRLRRRVRPPPLPAAGLRLKALSRPARTANT